MPLKDQADIKDRILAAELPGKQHQHRDEGNCGECADGVGCEPVVFLAFIEDDFQTTEPQGDQHEAEDVKPEAAFEPLCSLPLERFGLADQPGHEGKGYHADRHVDEEDPIPRPGVGNIAAEGRPDRRRNDYRDAVEREGLRALFGRKGVGQHRLLDRRHAAAAQALQHPECN